MGDRHRDLPRGRPGIKGHALGPLCRGVNGSDVRQAVRQLAGAPKPRNEINDDWRRYRELGIEQARSQVERFYDKAEPPVQRLLRYAGMDPEHVLLRWGNYDWTLALSSKVFEADEEGRAYRLRPRMRSIWLKNLE